MIDWFQPIQLDDGTPVRLVSFNKAQGCVRVELPGGKKINRRPDYGAGKNPSKYIWRYLPHGRIMLSSDDDYYHIVNAPFTERRYGKPFGAFTLRPKRRVRL